MSKPEAKILFQSRELTKSYNTGNFVRPISLKQAHITYGLPFKQEEGVREREHITEHTTTEDLGQGA